MTKLISRKTFTLLAILCAIYWLPWVSIHLFVAPAPQSIEQLEKSDAVLVFGALVRNGKVSPLQHERLMAAKQLVDNGLVDKIVVSNEHSAARVMYEYLIQQKVQASRLEIDGGANKTPDTCRNEKATNKQRSLIFLSQNYHLSRLYYQCKRLGVKGQLFAADSLGIVDRTKTPWWVKLRVRSLRYGREAALTWIVIPGVYK